MKAFDIAIRTLENESGVQIEQKTTVEKYHKIPLSEIRLKELLPLIRSAGYSNRDELGYSVVLCPECKEWTWTKFNASSCLLDALGDLRVEGINAEDGNIRLWIMTDDFNWIMTDDFNWLSKPEGKTGQWIPVGNYRCKCSECDAHRETRSGFFENYALEIVEQQKPKSPIIEPYFYGAKFLCPKCSQFLGKEYNIAHINYCGKCSQAILIKEAKNE